jgi:hypothetical protein
VMGTSGARLLRSPAPGCLRSNQATLRIYCDRESLAMTGKMKSYVVIMLVILLLLLWACATVSSASMVWSG